MITRWGVPLSTEDSVCKVQVKRRLNEWRKREGTIPSQWKCGEKWTEQRKLIRLEHCPLFLETGFDWTQTHGFANGKAKDGSPCVSTNLPSFILFVSWDKVADRNRWERRIVVTAFRIDRPMMTDQSLRQISRACYSFSSEFRTLL